MGQHNTDTLLILDGTVQVYGLYNNEMIGVMSAGSHFGNDLSDIKTIHDQAKQFSNQRSDLKMNSHQDNFDNKSLVHLVAFSFAVVGYLSQEDTKLLYLAYPEWKKMMQTLNGFLFEMAKISLGKHTTCMDKPINRL